MNAARRALIFINTTVNKAINGTRPPRELTAKEQFVDAIETKANLLKDKKTGDRPFTVVVEGNIGCGKTTMLSYLSKNDEIQIYSEPVKDWRNLNGHNLLELMYSDPTRWSLTFQTYVQYTMLQLHNKSQRAPVKMIERSIYSARYCFVENLFRSGKMPEAEYIVLDTWFQWLIKNTQTQVDLIVYLRTRPETVLNRIVSRARPEEVSIKLNFLETLHKLHEDWLIKKCFPVPAPVWILDVDCDLRRMEKHYDRTHKHILYEKKKKIN